VNVQTVWRIFLGLDCSMRMMKILLLLFLAGLCRAQVGFNPDVNTLIANMPRVTELGVVCSLDGMTVNLQFSAPFNGIVYSKGFYDNPQCRYVQANTGRSSFQFVVPMNSCGTEGRENPEKLFFNTITIQMDEFITEVWDSARMITCAWKNSAKQTVTFKPFVIDMLDVQRLNFSGDDVSVRVQIQRGRGPFAEELNGIVKIGEELTIAVFVDGELGGQTNYDVLVSNCFAYSSSNVTSPFTSNVKLSDANGCLLKPKLLNYFQRTMQTGNTGSAIIAFAYMNAFKFPDKSEMHLTCEVDLCKGGCDGHCGAQGYPDQLVQISTDVSPNFRLPPKPTGTNGQAPVGTVGQSGRPAFTTRPRPTGTNGQRPTGTVGQSGRPAYTTRPRPGRPNAGPQGMNGFPRGAARPGGRRAVNHRNHRQLNQGDLNWAKFIPTSRKGHKARLRFFRDLQVESNNI